MYEFWNKFKATRQTTQRGAVLEVVLAECPGPLTLEVDLLDDPEVRDEAINLRTAPLHDSAG